MPVFGKTLFETVIDSLADQDAEEAPAFRVNPAGLNFGFVPGETAWPEAGDVIAASRYDDFSTIPDLAPAPARIDELTQEEIAAELDLGACGSEAALRERRRHFALENHPDRLAQDLRDRATIRMMIANQLIDRAIRRFGQA